MSVIQGVGSSHYGRFRGVPLTSLVADAVTEALADAEVEGIDAVFFGSVFGEMGVAQRALHPLGIHDVPIVRVENACASGTTAFHEACIAVDSGRYERVLVVGAEHMTSRFRGPIPLEERDPHGRAGLYLPSMYAMAATRYVEHHGVTPEQLAQVAVKNRRHASLNPRVADRRAVTVEEVLGSRMISDPLTLLQCSPVTDAAAAVVVGRERGVARDVEVLASVFASGGLWDHTAPSVWGHELIGAVAHRAFEQAGLGPDDLDVVECHDAFTIGEIVVYECLGLAAEGDGAKLVADGSTALGGTLPVNPSGGLIGRGHPLGATGVAQLVETVWQLRGDAGDRQVDGARTGLVETMGGGVTGIDGNACVVVVLQAGAAA